MKKILPLILVTLFACGPSAEEKAKIQKEREDSIRVATESATRLRLEKKLSLTEELKNAEANKEGQENRLSFLKGELEVQKDKLNTIKQPQFLRTPDEREQQIRAQVMTIEQAEKDIANLQDEIAKTGQRINDLRRELKDYE
jgi:hypothetical protein